VISFSSPERLRDLMESFGQVSDVRLMYHPGTNRSRRFESIVGFNRDVITLSAAIVNYRLPAKSFIYVGKFVSF
jgi:hypothetical protein